jgi:hypothetical protein
VVFFKAPLALVAEVSHAFFWLVLFCGTSTKPQPGCAEQLVRALMPRVEIASGGSFVSGRKEPILIQSAPARARDGPHWRCARLFLNPFLAHCTPI